MYVRTTHLPLQLQLVVALDHNIALQARRSLYCRIDLVSAPISTAHHATARANSVMAALCCSCSSAASLDADLALRRNQVSSIPSK